MSWSDDKELLSGANDIGQNSLIKICNKLDHIVLCIPLIIGLFYKYKFKGQRFSPNLFGESLRNCMMIHEIIYMY